MAPPEAERLSGQRESGEVMSYLVLARKYRPQRFEEVIGQEHITQTLKNAILQKRIGHAYLFSGSRGIGKTTTARIFAKALNCVNGPTVEPCQTCSPCQEITRGNAVDVFEIDAASNRGIDEVRALRENVKFAPAACRYKIYVIDEAHQITPEAFNALLKTLEEPPAHVIFIFATTEPQKIPATILSRCQRFAFRPVPTQEIVKCLKEIQQKEKLSVDPEAIEYIAHLAQGSVRDAESLLDEALSFSPETVQVKDLDFLLNILPTEYLQRFGQAFLSLNKKAALDLIAQVNEAGYNLHQTVKDLREYFRKLLLLKFSAGQGLGMGLSPEEAERLKKESEKFTSQLLLRYISLLSHCLEEMKWSDQPMIIFETYALRLASPYLEIDEILKRIEDLKKTFPSEVDVVLPKPDLPLAKEEEPVPMPVPELLDLAGDKSTLIPPKEEVSTEGLQLPKVETSLKTPPTDENLYGVTPVKESPHRARWAKVIEEIKKKKYTLGSYLESGHFQEFKNNILTLVFAEKFYQEGTEKNAQFIEETWEKMFAEKIKVRCVLGKIKREEKTEVLQESEVETPGEIFTLKENSTTKEKSIKEETAEPLLKKLARHFPEAKIIE